MDGRAPEPPSIRLRHLTCLVTLARERTLARTAARLGLTQPAISKTLADLESIAGERLVDRGRHGARLTPAGERLLPHALQVTQALDAAEAALRRADGQAEPVVEIGALPTVAGPLLARAITRLHTERPLAGVRVRTESNDELLTALKAGEIDLALARMAEPSMMQGLSFELWYTEALTVAIRPQHPLAGAALVSWPDLLEFDLVVPGPGTAPRHQTDMHLRELGLDLPPGCTQTQSVTLARSLTLISDAVWIVPQQVVRADLDAGLLHRLDVPAPGPAEAVGLLHRTAAPLHAPARQLLRILRTGS